ncbi:MAG: YbgC/FadM family acyl-CoA thioesterase [Burkholderiales bacterium]
MAFEHPIRVYWEDTDAGGIVFYANYLKFFERARTEWLRSLGLEQRRISQQTGGMFVVSETALKYHAPARLDDLLIVTADLQRKGAASLVLSQKTLLKSERTENSDAPLLLCAGTIRIGWVDSRTLTPARIPKTILEVLQ